MTTQHCLTYALLMDKSVIYNVSVPVMVYGCCFTAVMKVNWTHQVFWVWPWLSGDPLRGDDAKVFQFCTEEADVLKPLQSHTT